MDRPFMYETESDGQTIVININRITSMVCHSNTVDVYTGERLSIVLPIEEKEHIKKLIQLTGGAWTTKERFA